MWGFTGLGFFIKEFCSLPFWRDPPSAEMDVKGEGRSHKVAVRRPSQSPGELGTSHTLGMF